MPCYDQQLGGLLTWLPPAMMSVLGALVVLRRLMHATPTPALSEARPPS